jgi:hypothetical protein
VRLELRQQRPPGRIGQRREGAIELGWIVNHVVKYRRMRAGVKLGEVMHEDVIVGLVVPANAGTRTPQQE